MRKKTKVEPQVYSNAEILNYLISKFKYHHYLEIGVCGYKNKTHSGETWHNIRVSHKDGVDPRGEPANYHMTSDEFFASIDASLRWDIIFIDGNHQYKYVKRDLANSLNHLNEQGLIALHDVYPHPYHLRQGLPFANIFSHVWCAIADLSLTRDDLSFHLLEVPIERGIGIIRFAENRQVKKLSKYSPGKPINWIHVQDIKRDIFDEVIPNGEYKELFKCQKKEEKKSEEKLSLEEILLSGTTMEESSE